MAYTLENLGFDLLLMLLVYLYVFAMILLPMALKKKDKISKFIARKMVHFTAGLAVLSSPFFASPWFAVVVAGSLSVFTLLSSKKSKVKVLKELYDTIGEEQEEKVGYLQGPFHYCLSITVLIAFFVIFAPDKLYFPIAGILIMIISDTLASLVGKNYGKIKIRLSWTNTTRTVEGSTTFFISAFILCFLSFLIFGLVIPMAQHPFNTLVDVLIVALVTSALATVIELISPSTWDDLLVPILSTLIIYLLSFIFL